MVSTASADDPLADSSLEEGYGDSYNESQLQNKRATEKL